MRNSSSSFFFQFFFFWGGVLLSFLVVEQVAPKPNTFLPFGTGAHSCPGNELAKLEILILIHHLVNKLRWDKFQVIFSKFTFSITLYTCIFWNIQRIMCIYHKYIWIIIIILILENKFNLMLENEVLTSSYVGCRWEVVGSHDVVEYSPFPVPHNGLQARFWREPEVQEICD